MSFGGGLAFHLPKIYPITDRLLSGASHADQVRELALGGAALAQIREKHLSPREFFNEAEAAIRAAHESGVRIILNDRVDFALILSADGVHLGQDDLPPDRARMILGDRAIIGFSTHSVEQAIDAIKLPVDYIAIGPIFSTKTKPDHAEAVGIEGLRRVRAAVGSFPIVAIGGVDRKNLVDVLNAGADSAAIISDIFNRPQEIAASLSELLRIAGE